MWFQWLVINRPYSNNDPKWNQAQNLVFDLKNISWKFGVKIQMFTRVPLSEKDVFGAISSFPFIWIWPWFHNITKAGTSLKIKIYVQKITLKSFWVISCHWIRYPAVYVISVVGNKPAIFYSPFQRVGYVILQWMQRWYPKTNFIIWKGTYLELNTGLW